MNAIEQQAALWAILRAAREGRSKSGPEKLSALIEIERRARKALGLAEASELCSCGAGAVGLDGAGLPLCRYHLGADAPEEPEPEECVGGS